MRRPHASAGFHFYENPPSVPEVSAREIKTKQLRALLLLLVLVPLIPTALMIRFMLDAMEDKRTVVVDNLSALYQQTLAKADDSFGRQLAGRAEPITPREVHSFYRGLLDREAFIRVTTKDGRPITGVSLGARPVIAQTSLHLFDLPWLVQVHLLDERRPDEMVREQFRVTIWTISALVISIFGIAAATAWTVSQQLALRELKSTAVATVAHELRTPLASMRLLVDTLLAGRYRSSEQLQEYLGMIATENQRLSRLTENFLTFARLDGRKEPFAQERLAP
ncbi:MAG TPA: histidine kinase dimerization/phospho-acceptor domain-containing protein, partial [Chthoniobacteraceae bacterium]